MAFKKARQACRGRATQGPSQRHYRPPPPPEQVTAHREELKHRDQRGEKGPRSDAADCIWPERNPKAVQFPLTPSNNARVTDSRNFWKAFLQKRAQLPRPSSGIAPHGARTHQARLIPEVSRGAAVWFGPQNDTKPEPSLV